MALTDILDYVNTTIYNGSATIGEGYGTEHFCIFLYALLKMDKPNIVVELGIGGGVTACLAAQALRENGSGMLWGVDNGSDWPNVRLYHQKALGYNDDKETYASFLKRLFAKFELASFVTHVDMTLGRTEFYAPDDKIDVLFADATSSGPEGCIHLLRYYLPRMAAYSSIFIDKASTINHSYLLLNYLVEQLNQQKIPLHILRDLTPEQEADLRRLVAGSKFTAVHLAENDRGKHNRKQNSRAWIKIEPCDFLPQNQVSSFDMRGAEMGRRGNLLSKSLDESTQ